MNRPLSATVVFLVWSSFLLMNLASVSIAYGDDAREMETAAVDRFPEFEIDDLGPRGSEVTSTSGKIALAKANPEVDSTNGANDSSYTVVCFLGTECPLAKLYAVRLNELQKAMSNRPVRFVGVVSNFQDSADDIKRFANEQNLRFPIGKDFDQRIADSVNVKRTPEVFVVANANLKIFYRGRVDDQYAPGVSRSAPQRKDLKIAIDELLSNRPVAVARTAPEGCLLGRSARQVSDSPTVTWVGQVKTFVTQNCAECHRAGDIGPFSMEQYEEVVGWADMMMETIDEKRMPPWHADPHVGKFINERRLAESEIESFRTWIAEGTPYGPASTDRSVENNRGGLVDAPSEQLPEESIGRQWNLPREPDQIVDMADSGFVVPADGIVEYQYFVVDPKFETDRWVSAVDVQPGNRAVVHHSIVFVRPPDGTAVAGVGWLGAYVPGQKPLAFDPRRARFVPAGSKLVFQQHYTTIGQTAEDITRVGLVFADESEVEQELLTLMAINQDFEIEPHESSHRVAAEISNFGRDAKLISVSPHMHFRGKSFQSTLHRKPNRGESSGTSEVSETSELIVSVPQYDFNWQHVYQFVEPIALNNVKKLTIDVEFDNSENNPFNPDPNAWVMWGDQTFEEMAVAFFDVQRPRWQPARKNNNEEITNSNAADDRETDRAASSDEGIDSLDADQRKRLDDFVEKYFERFDGNGDGRVTSSELPIIKQHEPKNFDNNGDRGISKDELKANIWVRFAK